MTLIKRLAPYRDELGNSIEFDGEPLVNNIWIRFRGSNNTLVVHRAARIKVLKVYLDCDNARIEIGPTRAGIPTFSAAIRAGQDATVQIGRDVTMTGVAFISATEGTSVTIGEDVMFSTNNEVRADDAHPIFDVRTERRVNVSRSITIGPHVWLGRDAAVLGGVTIGKGTVVGYRGLVTRSLPNNCVAVGTPAAVVRRDIAWERPHLDSFPPYKPDASTITKTSKYWQHTVDLPGQAPLPRRVTIRLRRAARRVGRRLRRGSGRDRP